MEPPNPDLRWKKTSQVTHKGDEHIWDGIRSGADGGTREGLKVRESMSFEEPSIHYF